MEGLHVSDEPMRLEKLRKAQQIMLEIRAIVDGWVEWQRTSPSSSWTKQEYEEVVWISETLADPTWKLVGDDGVALPRG